MISTPKKLVKGAIGCYIPKSIQKNSGNVQSPGCLIDAYSIIVYIIIYIPLHTTSHITYYVSHTLMVISHIYLMFIQILHLHRLVITGYIYIHTLHTYI